MDEERNMVKQSATAHTTQDIMLKYKSCGFAPEDVSKSASEAIVLTNMTRNTPNATTINMP